MIIDIQHFIYVVVKIGCHCGLLHISGGATQCGAVAAAVCLNELRKESSVVDQLARRFPFTYGLYNKIV